MISVVVFRIRLRECEEINLEYEKIVFITTFTTTSFMVS